MKTLFKKTIIFLFIVAVTVVGWWLISPLFIDNKVDEALPFEMPSEIEMASISGDKAKQLMENTMQMLDAESMQKMGAEKVAKLERMIMKLAELVPVDTLKEKMPNAGTPWQLTASGQFKDADSFHKGTGKALIYSMGAQKLLRFEDFKVTNGPDLHVFVVENLAASHRDKFGRFIHLGSLKGNIGNQNYDLAAQFDESKYQGVMIYCMPFHTVFSTAAF
jgi:hypothetical protein